MFQALTAKFSFPLDFLETFTELAEKSKFRGPIFLTYCAKFQGDKIF